MDLTKNAFSVLSLVHKIARTSLRESSPLLGVLQTRNYAARKGTREKAKKKKVKVEVKKIGFIPHNLRDKGGSKVSFESRRQKEHSSMKPVDNVWISRFYQWKIYDFEEAVNAHRETHHPQIYNLPNAMLHAFIELDLTGVKKNKHVDPFNRIAPVPNRFNHGEDRTILVFCKTPEIIQQAEAAGADQIGDPDFIKKIERGELVLPDYQFIIGHPNILPELVGIRGILKKKFPSPKLGTLGPDIGNIVETFKSGINYWALRDAQELDYGWVDTAIGTLDMKVEALEQNLKSLLDDINTKRPNRDGQFITRIMLKSDPSMERFKLDLNNYVTEQGYESDSDDEAVKKK